MNRNQTDTSGKLVEEIRKYYSGEPRVSPWMEVTQENMNLFAEATQDLDWMHIDPDRARRESPFGTTIAFGFWTLSMLTHLQKEIFTDGYPPGIKFALNYGFNRIRLIEPIPIGSRIRNCFVLSDVTDRGDGQYLIQSDNTIEIENLEKPAMVAEWLALMIADQSKFGIGTDNE